jgi:hypothetical protein
MEHGHWGKFRHAVDDTRELSQRVPASRLMALILERAQHFYLPEAYNPIEGKLLSPELQEIFKLPFPITAVLSECDFFEDARTSTGFIDTSDVISIGIEPDFFKQFMPEFNFFHEDGFNGGWAICSANYSNKMKKWFSMPFFGIARHKANEPGVELRLLPPPPGTTGVLPKFTDDQLELITVDFQRDLNRLQNLCMMLSCHNVQQHKVEAPAKLNKARAKKNKLPLPDYHVLKVDGTLWDQNPSAKTGDGPGYRSHYRRGHRREFKPGKFTWVTQAMVHGKQPGFVEKDYEIA